MILINNHATHQKLVVNFGNVRFIWNQIASLPKNKLNNQVIIEQVEKALKTYKFLEQTNPDILSATIHHLVEYTKSHKGIEFLKKHNRIQFLNAYHMKDLNGLLTNNQISCFKKAPNQKYITLKFDKKNSTKLLLSGVKLDNN